MTDDPRQGEGWLPYTGVPMPGEWADLAVCRGIDPDFFFPPRGQSTHGAKRLCACCPVQGPCLEYAMRYHIRHGVWGGKGPRDRQALARRRRTAA